MGTSGDAEAVARLLAEKGRRERVREYLLANSHLPGPRANLGLAAAFADAVGSLAEREPRRAFEVCLDLCAVTEREAPSNSKAEFLPLCGAVGLGSLDAAERSKVLAELKRLSHDGRWRTREGVAMALQRILARSGLSFARELEGWVSDEDWLQMRAVVAGVADPPLLKRDPALARAALELHQRVITKLRSAEDRRSEQFRVLRQALGYSLSVVVAEVGPEAFEYMRALAASGDEELAWILRENLKKDRLKRSHPDDVKELSGRLRRA